MFGAKSSKPGDSEVTWRDGRYVEAIFIGRVARRYHARRYSRYAVRRLLLAVQRQQVSANYGRRVVNAVARPIRHHCRVPHVMSSPTQRL